MTSPSTGIQAYPVTPIILPVNYADYTVTKTVGDAWQTIASCMGHIPATMSELGTIFPQIQKVDPMLHTCMGCLKGWRRDNS